MADKTVKLLITADGRQAESTLSGLSGTLSKFGPLAGAALGALSLSKLSGDLLAVNTETQRLQASLRTITGSSAGAEAAFANLSKFAAETPFQLTELVTAFTKLKAMGLDPSEDSLRAYGNTASAMGKDLNMMIEAVADAATGEFERLKEFGIKAKSQGDQVSFTFQGVTTTIGKNAAEIEGYLRGIGENQFAGAMTEQMQTLGGATSNMADAYDNLLRSIGDAGANAIAIEGISKISALLSEAAGIISPSVTQQVADLGNEIKGLQEQLAVLGNTPAFLKLFYPSETSLQEQIAALEAERALLEAPTVGPQLPAGGRPTARASSGSANRAAAGPAGVSTVGDAMVEEYRMRQEAAATYNQLVIDSDRAAAEERMGISMALNEMERADRARTVQAAVDAQLAGDEAMMENMVRMKSEYEKDQQMKRDGYQNTLSFISSIDTLFYNDSGKKSKAAFRVNQGVSSANAIINTATGATKAFSQYGWPWGAVAAAAVIAAGAVQLQQIWSANPEGGRGGTAATPVTGAMNLTTGNGPVVQPSVGRQDTGRSITIQVQGNIIGEDKWVEESFLPALRRAEGRNVLVMA